MRKVSFTEFRQNASALLDRVEQGETILILRHGKAIARLVAADEQQARPAWKRPGPHLVSAGASLSRALLEQRRSSP